MSNFSTLRNINVNEHTEKKNGLTYLSWAWAWDTFCKEYDENATYHIYKNEHGLPYVYDPNTGYMCYVSVTAKGKTNEMWLPVMDSANYAMKAEPYKVKTKYKEIEVKPATMFDVNKTLMRCLVKCLAMFGLGLYIYAGEDLPTEVAPEIKMTREELMENVLASADIKGVPVEEVCKMGGVETLDALSNDRLEGAIKWLSQQ